MITLLGGIAVMLVLFGVPALLRGASRDGEAIARGLHAFADRSQRRTDAMRAATARLHLEAQRATVGRRAVTASVPAVASAADVARDAADAARKVWG